MLQYIVLPPNYSFCSFSPTLSPSSSPLPILHQPVTTLPLSPTHSSPLTSLLYQLYTTPAPCNPWHKHPPLQQQKYTQTHARATKPSSSHNSSPTHPPLFQPPF
jgi:hypothetical protein